MSDWKCKLIFLLICFACSAESDITNAKEVNVTPSSDSFRDCIFISTISGALYVVDSITGNIKAVLQESPVSTAPLNIRSVFTFLPDPRDGSLYVINKGELKKLPFTIPTLVQLSPCKSSDGLLFAGTKQDSWLAIHKRPYNNVEISRVDDIAQRTCPAAYKSAIFIGRSEYRVHMVDSMNANKRWNVTFVEYATGIIPIQSDYSFEYYSSCSDGLLVTVDANSGRIIWSKNFNSTIVDVYQLQLDGLKRLQLNVFGKDTLEHFVDQQLAQMKDQISPTEDDTFVPSDRTLYPSVYIGEHSDGLYALPSLVDEKTVVLSFNMDKVPRIAGPHPVVDPESVVDTGTGRIHVDIDRLQWKVKYTLNGEQPMIFLGHHEVPSTMETLLVFNNSPKPTLNLLTAASDEAYTKSRQRWLREETPETVSKELSIWYYLPTAAMILITTLLVRYVLSLSIGKKSKFCKNKTENQVGRILLYKNEVLGRGSDGTVVYKGDFDGHPIAVKQMIRHFASVAHHEVQVLRRSDRHPNVIRYYCTESDEQFLYIALELCSFTLEKYVEQPEMRELCKLQPQMLLKQISNGLQYLHQLGIVHRDLKPQNVLIALTADNTRALLSDFGLCRTLHSKSWTHGSGSVGTVGWIAPEVIQLNLITFASDVFSLGCVYYYVLTEGEHPFGDVFYRQANIAVGKYECCPSKRLKTGKSSQASKVACYFLIIIVFFTRGGEFGDENDTFNSSFKTKNGARFEASVFLAKIKAIVISFGNFGFRIDVSDRVEKETSQCELVQHLEHRSSVIVNRDWRQCICPLLQADLRRFRTYRGGSVCDLLRAMRNKRHHYYELPEEVRKALGTIPDGFIDYFTERFPLLLIHVYEAMCAAREEPLFKVYY
ncbi:Serine/threonine-protein kinase/endoribonuclease ire-1 [Trichinella zimbabwensis]|uniref:non-specific serine/threonine protein kinase n=1 Tax=Trichinella zimbabwensis TaxID=268475 RepID=A0A0V1GXJ6_9BILA|nr:Serine/threonine-protein kinase/endoribonuclease ire-1 [Trichinella zimbabwensis]